MRAQGDYETARAAFIARQPMGRLGTPEEIADLAVYLAGATYTTRPGLRHRRRLDDLIAIRESRDMKLVRFGEAGRERPGLIDADGRRSATCRGICSMCRVASSIRTRWPRSPRSIPQACRWPSAKPRIGPCVAGTGKFICIGLNYSDHAAETGATVPPEPIIFMKATSAIVGPDDDVVIPRGSAKDRLGGRARRRHRPQGEIRLRGRGARLRRRLLRRARRFRARVPDRARRANGPRARAATRSARSARGW